MKNTIENKMKMFAQYFGQKVSNGYLELKNLESMPDEDVLKIAEVVLWRNSKISESAMITQTKEFLLQSSKIFTLRGEEWANVIDKARELGYAYRWNGISVSDQIDFGWIKLI